MPSAQLVLAAQTNGKKSRGPKTPEGKRKSAANSRKHGLYAKTFHPDPACEAEFHRFLAIYRSEHPPTAQHEHNLVHTAALALARKRWAARLAVEIINNELQKDEAQGIPITPSCHFHAVDRNITALNKLHIVENRCYNLWSGALDRLQEIRLKAIQQNRTPELQERTESKDARPTENHPNEPNSFTTPATENQPNEPNSAPAPATQQTCPPTSDTINQHQMRPLSLGLLALLIPFAGAQNPPPLSIPGAIPPDKPQSAPTTQSQTPAPAQKPTEPANEVGTNDTSITFQSKVNLVLVPVVVRDKNGKPVDGLTKEDFNLFDKGKAQTISRFSVEKASLKIAPPAPRLEKSPDAKSGDADAPDLIAPSHFVAWFFDDIHLNPSDLIQARNAAEKYLSEGLKDTDRAAIYTTSGQTSIDFTDNLNQLRDGLAQLRPHPVARAIGQECPDVSYYRA